jgi:Circadian oscillating protein COP23
MTTTHSASFSRRFGHAGALAALLSTSFLGMAPAQAAGDVILPTDTTTIPAPVGGSTVPAPGTTGTTVPTETGNVPISGVRFFCQSNGGQPTVMYQPESQPDRAYPWAIPSAMGGGWSPEARCQEIAKRLEQYRPDGLVEMATAVENGLNTICVTTDRAPACRIVLTVPNGQDPIATRDRIFNNLASADDGQMTQGVNTYGSTGNGNLLGNLGNVLGIPGLGGGSAVKPRNAGLNLRPFLDRADDGTGSKLKGGVAYAAPKPAVVAPKPVEVAKPVVKPVEVKPAVKPAKKPFTLRRVR